MRVIAIILAACGGAAPAGVEMPDADGGHPADGAESESESESEPESVGCLLCPDTRERIDDVERTACCACCVECLETCGPLVDCEEQYNICASARGCTAARSACVEMCMDGDDYWDCSDECAAAEGLCGRECADSDCIRSCNEMRGACRAGCRSDCEAVCDSAQTECALPCQRELDACDLPEVDEECVRACDSDASCVLCYAD